MSTVLTKEVAIPVAATGHRFLHDDPEMNESCSDTESEHTMKSAVRAGSLGREGISSPFKTHKRDRFYGGSKRRLANTHKTEP